MLNKSSHLIGRNRSRDFSNARKETNYIQIIHISEGISKNYPQEVPLEQSGMTEAIAEGVWTVLKVPNMGNFTNALTDVYYLFYKIIFYLFYKMMFSNTVLIMTGHYHWIMTGTLPKLRAITR